MLHRAATLRRAPRFPVIVGADTGTAAAQTLSLPYVAGEAGDLIVISASGGSSDSRSLSAVSGWQELWRHGNFNSNLRVFGGWYRVAPAAGAGSVNISASDGVNWSGVSVRIARETYSGAPTASASALGTSSSPNPADLTAPRPGPHLWLAVGCCIGNFSASPDGYSSLGTADVGSGSNDTQTRISRRFLRAASENPGAFSSGSTNWGARTVCIPGWS